MVPRRRVGPLDAALSWLRDNGMQRLPEFALASALGMVPTRLHKVAVGALLMVGLWVETAEGYELRESAHGQADLAAIGQREAQLEARRVAERRRRVSARRTSASGSGRPRRPRPP